MLAKSIRHRSPADAKGRAFLTLDLAECHVIDGEIDQATHLAVSALDLVDGSMVQPIVTRALAVRDRMKPWNHNRAVAELEMRLDEVPALGER